MSKYKNKPTEYGGYSFASMKEARRYQELIMLQSAGLIRDLTLQPPFALVVNGQKIGKYLADFSYVDIEKDVTIVEDVKSMPTRTAVYRIKVKLVHALYGIQITEV